MVKIKKGTSEFYYKYNKNMTVSFTLKFANQEQLNMIKKFQSFITEEADIMQKRIFAIDSNFVKEEEDE